jgi:hypothetical protein
MAGRKRKGKVNPRVGIGTEVFETPTSERLKRAEGYYTQAGPSRVRRRFVMMDDNLGRLVMHRQLTQQQFSALQRYAVHWYLAGFAGALASFDLDRICAMTPGGSGGLARSERQLTHQRIYRDAKLSLGHEHASVADMVACHDYPLVAAGAALGFASPFRGRLKARELLAEAGSRLDRFWQIIDKRAR